MVVTALHVTLARLKSKGLSAEIEMLNNSRAMSVVRLLKDGVILSRRIIFNEQPHAALVNRLSDTIESMEVEYALKDV